MEILLDLDICKNLPCKETLEVSDNDRKSIEKRVGLYNICNTKYVNIGPGADLIVLLIIVDIGLRTLKLGAEINDGIDGWIGLGKKLFKLFQQKKIVSIDADGAASMAIELISKKEKIEKLVKIHETTINLVDVSSILPQNIDLCARPHNYYIFAYQINNKEVYVVGVTSMGNANIIKHFEFNSYGISDIKL